MGISPSVHVGGDGFAITFLNFEGQKLLHKNKTLTPYGFLPYQKTYTAVTLPSTHLK